MTQSVRQKSPLLLRIGSRDSQLAIAQSRLVMAGIRRLYPQAVLELITMKTAGDLILDRPLPQIGGKGLFVKELELALLEGRADLTVHSLKDLPSEENPALPLVAFSPREDPRDCLVLPAGAAAIDLTRPIGCSSLRRQLQLKALYPGCRLAPVRGNIQTRLRKLDEGQFGALVLAAAGLLRLGLPERISRYFEPEEMLPAAGQGILAVQARQDVIQKLDALSGKAGGFFEGFSEPADCWAAQAERAFLRGLAGGCNAPAAAYAVIRQNRLILRGLYWEDATGARLAGSRLGPQEDAARLGYELALSLKNQRG
jgi:hydroxymethylbilane synthase